MKFAINFQTSEGGQQAVRTIYVDPEKKLTISAEVPDKNGIEVRNG